MTKNNNAFSLAGKKGLILGLANENSIAWGCTQLAHQMGAELVVSCLNDKARRFVEPLTAPLGVDLVAVMSRRTANSKRWWRAPHSAWGSSIL